MSYEKAVVRKITQGKPDKESGEMKTYVELDVMKSERCTLPGDARVINMYESLLGKEVLVPCETRTFEGRAYLALNGNFLPVPLSSSPVLVSDNSDQSKDSGAKVSGPPSVFPKTGT